MDGKGRWIDNVFIERLLESLKYGEVYLYACSDLVKADRVWAAISLLQRRTSP